MKKYLKWIFLALLSLVFVATGVSALNVLPANQGGTGIGSATTTDVGSFLQVSSSSPFKYILTPISSFASGTPGGIAYFSPDNHTLTSDPNFIISNPNEIVTLYGELDVNGLLEAQTTTVLGGFTGTGIDTFNLPDNTNNAYIVTENGHNYILMSTAHGSQILTLGNTATSSDPLVFFPGNSGIFVAGPAILATTTITSSTITTLNVTTCNGCSSSILGLNNIFTGRNTFTATTTFASTTMSSSTITTANLGATTIATSLNLTGATVSGLSVNSLSDTSTLAYLANNNTFTGTNTFATTTMSSSTVTNLNANFAFVNSLSVNSINSLQIPNNGANTLNIASGKSLTISNSLSFQSPLDGNVITFPTGGTVAMLPVDQTFTGNNTFATTTILGPLTITPPNKNGISGGFVYNDIAFNLPSHTNMGNIVYAPFSIPAAGAVVNFASSSQGYETMFIGQPQITATIAGRMPQAASLVIAGAPTAGLNMTITSTYALWAQTGLTELDGGLTVVSTSILSGLSFLNTNIKTTATTSNPSIILQNQDLAGALGANNLGAVTISPSYTGVSAAANIALLVSSTQKQTNPGSLTGIVIQLSNIPTSTISNLIGLSIRSPLINGTSTNATGLVIGDHSVSSGTLSYALQILSQGTKAATTRAIQLDGTSTNNGIRLGNTSNIYASTTSNITLSDSSDTGGVGFTLGTGLGGVAQNIITKAGSLNIIPVTGKVGINSSTPNFTLDDNGTLNVSGNSTLATTTITTSTMTTLNVSSGATFNTTTINSTFLISSANQGSCTLNGGAPSSCTATVPANLHRCICSANSGTALSLDSCSYSGTTFTANGAAGSAVVINYLCF